MTNCLGQYFNSISDILKSEFDVAGTQEHRGIRGTNREIFSERFLNKHLPRCLVAFAGGQILGSDGSLSKQIDLVIAHDGAIRFGHNAIPHTLTEGVSGVISVKSNLNREQLIDSLDNVFSIPSMNSKVITFPMWKQDLPFERYSKSYPRRFIFAFEGLEYQTIRQHISEYFTSHAKLGPGTVTVVVNGKYLIDCHYSPGSSPNLNGGYIRDEDKEMRGWPLFWMVADLSKVVPWLGAIQYEYGPYMQVFYSGSIFD